VEEDGLDGRCCVSITNIHCTELDYAKNWLISYFTDGITLKLNQDNKLIIVVVIN